MLFFVVASHVYIRRDIDGSITNVFRPSNLVVYFLANRNASLTLTIELICNQRFSGEIKVSCKYFVRIDFCCLN